MHTVLEPEPLTFLRAAEPVAQLLNVTKIYRNGIHALDQLSLSLVRGQITALLGPNGAGKSTAVKLLMGLSTPTVGLVRVFGEDPRFSANRLRTGTMLQVNRAPETLRVREHLNLFRGYYPHPLPATELMELAGLQGLENRFFGQLSGGQKQRVFFALALAGDPDLLFLDEPTAGLDVEARRALWAAIRAFAARGKTVLLTTHYLEEADTLANRIIVMAKGRVLREGTPHEVKDLGLNPGSSNQVPIPLPKAAKRIRCTTTASRERLSQLPGVLHMEANAQQAVITTNAPEATLRDLLALDPTLSGLELTAPTLEDAFLALTSE